MKVQVSPWRLLAPVYFVFFHFVGASFPVAAFLAVLLPSVAVEVSLTWKTGLAVLFVAVCCQVASDPTAIVFAKMFRDQTHSRLGTLAYRSPLGDWLKLAEPKLEAQPLPQPQLVQVTRTSKAGEQFKVLEALQLKNQSDIPADVPQHFAGTKQALSNFSGLWRIFH